MTNNKLTDFRDLSQPVDPQVAEYEKIMENTQRVELRYGDNVLWFLNELATFEPELIESDDFDVYGEDRNGVEGCATISITELAADAAKLIAAKDAELQEFRKAATPIYQLRDWHWYDAEKRIYDEVMAAGGEGRIVYTAPQPAPTVEAVPVVDADLLHIAASAIEDLLTNKDRTGEGVWYDVPARLRRAAMQQPVSNRDELPGWVMVPKEMTPEMMRAVQIKSEIGGYAASELSGAYDMFAEFWDVAVSAAPQQERCLD